MDARTPHRNDMPRSADQAAAPDLNLGAGVDLTPAAVDGYEGRRLLRRAPSADVYLACHPATGACREVVVVHQTPEAEDEGLRAAIAAAVAAARTLRHPGIAAVECLGRTPGGRLYVATARPVGRSLAELLAADDALPVRRALRLGLDVATAVAAAHAAGVIHGALSPASVVVLPPQDGRPERAVVLGFGTAAAQDHALVLGHYSEAVATSPYVSPERAVTGIAGLRDDVFGVGSVLLSMFIGSPPPLVRGPHGGPRPADADVERGAEPGPIIQILRRARTADVARRYASAGELAAALRTVDELLADPPAAAPPAVASRPVFVGTSPAVERLAVERPAVEPFAAEPFAAEPPAAERPAAGARAVAGRASLPPRARQTPHRRRTRRDAAVAAGIVAAVMAGWVGRGWYVQGARTLDAPPARVAQQPDAVVPAPAPAPAPGAQAAAPAAPVPAPEPARAPVPAGRAAEVAPAPRPTPARERLVASAAGVGSAPTPLAARAAATSPAALAGTAGAVAAGAVAFTARAADALAPLTASAAGVVVAVRPPAAAAPAAAAGPDATTAASAAAAAAGVRAALAEYASAIEARDLASLGRVYPGMTDAQRRAWVTFFGAVSGLRARFEVGEVTAAGATAHARVRGTYEYENLRPRRAERSPVQFTATLARDPAGWRLLAVQ